uniref:ATP synthase F0 subunit 8 n=1 Tax=Pseudoniphargus mercadali TaxID=2211518 RepID=A0A345UDU0_9CRUS|nr:ATP synthase F0 subunit 8 [Pseudoniphargus mercadali]
MPQMAPILWFSLFSVLFSLTYFLMNFMFFMCSPQEENKMIYSDLVSNLFWKW